MSITLFFVCLSLKLEMHSTDSTVQRWDGSFWLTFSGRPPHVVVYFSTMGNLSLHSGSPKDPQSVRAVVAVGLEEKSDDLSEQGRH